MHLSQSRPRRHRPLAVAVLLLAMLAAVMPTAAAASTTHRAPWKRFGFQDRATTATPWRLAFRDDFDGSALDAERWGTYSGVANSGGLWMRSHVVVRDGAVTLAGHRDAAAGGAWASGGFNNRRGLIQTYGKYRIRMRVDDVVGLSYAVLLWPQSNVAPPEVDIVEGFGRSMQRTKATVHSGTPLARVRHGQVLEGIDMSTWRVVGLEWTPGKLVFTMDDKPWWEVTGPRVPSTPMLLALQAQIHDCGGTTWACPLATGPTSMNMHIDWVEAYRWRPSS